MGTRTVRRPDPASTRSAPARTSVADALFTSTQQRVLALLFGQPERSFFTRELIELSGGGGGAVQRELARLHQSGLLVQTSLGNQKRYQANAQAPIHAELCAIAAKMLGPADTLKQALMPIAGKIELALLYGSVAARRDTAGSDFDVLLVSDELTLEEVYDALAPAEKRLGRTIHPTLYTTSEFRRRRAQGNPFVRKLLAGRTVALIGDRDAFLAAG